MRKNSAGAPQIVDSNNYYPFGLSHIGQEKGLLGGYLNYKFGGKEPQETGRFDFGARFYMPDLGRWGVIDPLAETSRRFTPYNYAYNNPISFIDPDGRKAMNPDEERMSFASGGALEYNLSGRSGSFSNFLGFDDPIDALNRNVKRGGGGNVTKKKLTIGDLLKSSPNFKFSKDKEEEYKKKFPAFYNLVKNILPKMSQNESFMKDLSDVSGFSINELNEIFQYGRGAILRIGDLPFARTQDKSLINVIDFDEKVVNWYEKANKNTNTLEGLINTFWMIMVTGHETSHWGDSTKRNIMFKDTPLVNDFGNEIGSFFEYKVLRSSFPNPSVKQSLYIGNYGPNISDVFKNFVKINFNSLSGAFKN